MSGYEAFSATAASNSNVDGAGGTNIAENNAPATTNNAIRALVAEFAKLRDLIGGAKVSGGTADVQTLTSGLSLSAYQQGILIGFEAGSGLTNTGACTMNVDGIGAKSVKLVDGSDPAAGAITAGGIYMLAYESDSDTLLLLNPTPVAADADTLYADVGDTLTAGYVSDVYDHGEITSGTVTPAPATGQENYQTLENGGAFTLNVLANSGSAIIEVTNNSNAGAITVTAYGGNVDGDTLDTTDGNKFLLYVTRCGSTSHLTVKADAGNS